MQSMCKDQYELITQGLSGDQPRLLTEPGMDDRGKAKILQNMTLTQFPKELELGEPVARFPDFLTDPALIDSTLALAVALREFSQSSKIQPLFIPLVTNKRAYKYY